MEFLIKEFSGANDFVDADFIQEMENKEAVEKKRKLEEKHAMAQVKVNETLENSILKETSEESPVKDKVDEQFTLNISMEEVINKI